MKKVFLLAVMVLLLAGCADKNTTSVRIYKAGASGSYSFFGMLLQMPDVDVAGGKPKDLYVKFHDADCFVEFGGAREEEENLE